MIYLICPKCDAKLSPSERDECHCKTCDYSWEEEKEDIEYKKNGFDHREYELEDDPRFDV